MQPVATSMARGNHEDQEYDVVLAHVQRRFEQAASGPLFTTDVAALWPAYLAALPEGERQYHTCHACRHFIERFGGLATIDEDGRLAPAIWGAEDANGVLVESFAALARLVRRAKVTGIFRSAEKVWGQPVTGIWRHLAVAPPAEAVYRGVVKTAFQAMAEKHEDFGQVRRALADFSADVLDQAVTVLKSEALYRSEKVLGQAEWLRDLQAMRNAAKGAARANVVWRAVALAPSGFCHPRASMIGSLLEDLASGAPFASVQSRFAAKMQANIYPRPQAAPGAGTIAQAEKIVAQLGVVGSLARRFARLDEIQAIWKPRASETPKAGGVFGHLLQKPGDSPIHVPAQRITWEKFARTVLEGASEIEVHAPASGNYGAILTAENADAPIIFQWDHPFSWYVYHGGSSASAWGLRAGWVRCNAITQKPSEWLAKHEHQGEGLVLILDGCVDTCEAGSAIFPECLKSDFHGIRSVIEAHSRTAKLGGRNEASACGLMLHKGGACEARLRARIGNTWIEYQIDRWD